MSRVTKWEVPNFPPLFSPLQLSPKYAFSLAFQSAFLWNCEHLGLSHQALLRDHRLGYVVYGAHLRYRDPLSYFDAEALAIETECGLKKHGAQAEVRCTFKGAGRVAADVLLIAIPLWIGEDMSHSAVPTLIEGEVLERYLPSEVQEAHYVAPVPARLRELETSATLLAEASHTVVLHRHLCEFADQWYFAETLGFINAGREALAFGSGGNTDEGERLRRGLKDPLKKVDIVFTRPGLLLDTLTVETRAFDDGGALVFAHQIWPEHRRQPCATALETV